MVKLGKLISSSSNINNYVIPFVAGICIVFVIHFTFTQACLDCPSFRNTNMRECESCGRCCDDIFLNDTWLRTVDYYTQRADYIMKPFHRHVGQEGFGIKDVKKFVDKKIGGELNKFFTKTLVQGAINVAPKEMRKDLTKLTKGSVGEVIVNIIKYLFTFMGVILLLMVFIALGVIVMIIFFIYSIIKLILMIFRFIIPSMNSVMPPIPPTVYM